MSIKSRLSNIPEGAGVLFFIQVFATLGFAVLYSTLVLYATQHLHFPAKKATAIMGVFGAFNYGLHLFGGYLGGRFLSNRNLFVGGMLLQVFGCGCIAGGSAMLLYSGLALFLTGSGLNVTCINMMLTQRFKPDDVAARRGVPLELRRHERRLLRRLRGRRALPADRELHEPLHLRDHRKLRRDRPRRRLLEDARRPEHARSPKRPTRASCEGGSWPASASSWVSCPIVWILLQYPDSTETLVKGICAVVGLSLVCAHACATRTRASRTTCGPT